MTKQSIIAQWVLLLLLGLAACQGGPKKNMEAAEDQTPETTHNTLSEAEIAEGWKLLFDGLSTAGWRVYGREEVTGWAVENGEFIALGQAGLEGQGNDIITEGQYENFELSLEWKISEAGNSGIFFYVVESPEYRAVYETGPEYQLIDDVGFPMELEPSQHTAANYGMHAPARIASKPAGEYNHTRLVVNNGQVEHWLNGERVVAYELWTPEWEALVQAGKWKDFPGYARARQGHIALQDHGNQCWFRNIKIREL
jgi:hypothetical protein